MARCNTQVNGKTTTVNNWKALGASVSRGHSNVGATFQWLMHIALGRQLGRNTEAYVDDIVVKSREARTLIEDLEETFSSLRKVDLRLNPEKCVFGVPFGKLLSFLVSHRGVEENPEKVKAIERMSPPQTVKEMQKLVGCVTSRGRFISKLGECAFPFFKLMKKKELFEWTPEADVAFQDLKRYLTSLPVMVAPRPLEPLVLSLAATSHSACAVLVAVREECQPKGLPHDSTWSVKTMQPQGSAPNATAVPTGDQAPEVRQPQEAPHPRRSRTTPTAEPSSSTQCTSLAQYYGTRGHVTPCRRSSCSCFSSHHARCATTSKATPSRSFRPTHQRGCSGAPMLQVGSPNGTSNCRHFRWSSAPTGSSRELCSLTSWRNGQTPQDRKRAWTDRSHRGAKHQTAGSCTSMVPSHGRVQGLELCSFRLLGTSSTTPCSSASSTAKRSPTTS